MKNLIEKIKSFFLPKKEEPELCYEEILYSDYIHALTEFSKPLGIIDRSIGPIDELSTGIGTCFTYNGSIILLIYPHNLCIKWNPLDENKFVLIEYDIEKGKQMLLEQLKLYKLHQQYLKEERMKADFE
jgi:hypothetical protein